MRTKIVYVAASEYKRNENEVFCNVCQLDNGQLVRDVFIFEFHNSPVLQVLDVDIDNLVRKAANASYAEVRRPCVVEYAGLIFDRHKDTKYPGGLTKAMWNALEPRFIEETNSGGTAAIAKAAVAYCDGKQTRVFTGETPGTIARRPKGKRKFYWDTVFQPDEPTRKARRTYSQIVEEDGLEYKMRELSQSSRAMLKLLNYLMNNPGSGLWK